MFILEVNRDLLKDSSTEILLIVYFGRSGSVIGKRVVLFRIKGRLAWCPVSYPSGLLGSKMFWTEQPRKLDEVLVLATIQWEVLRDALELAIWDNPKPSGITIVKRTPRTMGQLGNATWLPEE